MFLADYYVRFCVVGVLLCIHLFIELHGFVFLFWQCKKWRFSILTALHKHACLVVSINSYSVVTSIVCHTSLHKSILLISVMELLFATAFYICRTPSSSYVSFYRWKRIVSKKATLLRSQKVSCVTSDLFSL